MREERETPSAMTCVCHGLLPCDRALNTMILRLATATVDHLAGDERGIVGGQERNRCSLLLRSPGTLNGLLVPDVLTHFLSVSFVLFRVQRLSHYPRSNG